MWGEEGRGLCEVGHEDRQENPRLEDQVGRQGRCVQEVQAALWEGRPDLIISNPEKKDSWIVLDNQQSEAVNRAVEEKTHLVSIEDPPGSGKTIIGAEIARGWVEKTKEERGEEPFVIITNVSYKIKEDSPLVSQLKSRAEQMGGKFVPWSKI